MKQAASILIAGGSALILAGCGDTVGTPPAGTRIAQSGNATSEIMAAPTRAAAPDTAEDTQAALAVLQRYFLALSQGRTGDAYALWGRQGAASDMDAVAFADAHARYATYRATIGTPGSMNGSADRRRITVPVRVTGTLRDGGGPFALEGPVILERTAMDGGGWHLVDSDLNPRPGLPADPERLAMPPELVEARYRCVDGSRFTVRFDNRRDTATIVRDGRSVATLTGRRPASGIWYANDAYTLRGKGDDATFSQPGLPPLPCRAG